MDTNLREGLAHATTATVILMIAFTGWHKSAEMDMEIENRKKRMAAIEQRLFRIESILISIKTDTAGIEPGPESIDHSKIQ